MKNGTEANLAKDVRWDLSDLYAGVGDPALERDLAEGERLARELESGYRGRVAGGELDAATLRAAVEAYEDVHEIGARPAFYASLLVAASSQDAAALKLEQRAREAWTRIRNHLVFFPLELQAMPEARFDALAAEPALAPYRAFLVEARRHAPHALSEPEEKLLGRKSLTGRGAAVQLFDELTGSLRFELELGGERRTMTGGEVLALLRHPDRDLRRRASEVFLSTYRAHDLVLSSIFNTLLLDHQIDGELRRFDSPMAPRHLANEVSGATVEAMLEATVRHYPDVQETLRLKAELLGLPRLHQYDVYAPLAREPETIPFAEARALVLESFAGFDASFAEIAGRFFERRWIDAEVRPGKRHGAFCASHSPRLHPYVLTSYSGTSRDVSTLAHELGHGIHAVLASGQKPLVAGAPLVLAETASIFGEMVLVEALLERAPSPAVRAQILADVLDEIFGTVFRQTSLTRFELSAHLARRDGRLSVADLGRLWREAQTALFGDAVELPELYDWGWSYIPHFVHAPFYCYSYAFGELLVLALFERYREEGKPFVRQVISLLEKGGSEPPESALAAIGFDVTRPEFWEIGFGAVRRFASDLREALAAARAAGGASPDERDLRL
jgi:oligoendopeptidase F